MTETTSNIMNNSVLSTLNRLNIRQKLGVVLMVLLTTAIYPIVALMLVLTIFVVYYVAHRDQKEQQVPVDNSKVLSSGNDTKKIKFCTNCGEVIGDNNKFCGNCGQNVVI